MKKYLVELNQETVNFVQATDTEVSSRKSLLATLGSSLGIKSKTFLDYHKEFIEFDAKYTLIKQAIQNIYVPKELTDKYGCDWGLNFSTNLLEVTVVDKEAIKLIDNGTIVFTPNMEDTIVTDYKEEEDETDCVGGCGCAK